MRTRKRARREAVVSMLAAALIMGLTAHADAAEVVVTLEPVLEPGGTIRVDVLADIQMDLRTFGVTLSYDPTVLEIVEAEKNEAEWSLGGYGYGDPDVGVAGEVVLWGAFFDALTPTAGVSGSNVLLGEARFTHLASGDPQLALDFAQAPPFDNFVTTAGTVLDPQLDGVSFVPEPSGAMPLLLGLALLVILGGRRPSPFDRGRRSAARSTG